MPQIITGFDKYAQDARANKTLKLNEELARSGEVRAQAQDTREETRLGLDQARAMREVTQFDRIEAEAAAGADLRKKTAEIGYQALESEQVKREFAALMMFSGQVDKDGKPISQLPIQGFSNVGRLMLGKDYDNFALGDMSLIKDPKTGMFTNATFDNGQGDVRTFALNDPRLLETIGQNAGSLVNAASSLDENGNVVVTTFNNKTGEVGQINTGGPPIGTAPKEKTLSMADAEKLVNAKEASKVTTLQASLPANVDQFLPPGKPVTAMSLMTAIRAAKVEAEATRKRENDKSYQGPFDPTPYDTAIKAAQAIIDERAAELERYVGGTAGGGGTAPQGGAGGYNPGMIGGGGSGGTARATSGSSVPW